jgi:hypothetical protein
LFFASSSKIEKSAKNGRKVKAIALLFPGFCPFFENKKVAENRRKVKAYSLTFLPNFASQN